MKRMDVFALFLFFSSVSQAALIDPSIKDYMRSNQSKQIPVLIELNGGNSRQLPQRYNQEAVLNYLKEKNADSLQEFNKTQNLRNVDVQIENNLWITNMVSAKVSATGLKQLANNPTVSRIYMDGKISYSLPTTAEARAAASNYAFKETSLYQLMTSRPDVRGKGVVIGSLDTGVDGSHASLKGKIKLFYNAAVKKVTAPFDSQYHGTHTAGTMIGSYSNESGDIGMAPDAELIAASAITGYSQMLDSMQWIMDPDGNAATNDAPRAINNSWNCGGAPSINPFYKGIEAWEAANILPVFSAGNSGPGAATITPPHEHPLAFAVGATDATGNVASFSSRGPGKYLGTSTEKPDLTAPGKDITSTLPNGKYGLLSGTSMAAPHVTGATALLLQVAPQLNTKQIRDVMIASTGGTVWNANTGKGKLNVFEAVKLALLTNAKMLGLSSMSLENNMGLNAVAEVKARMIADESNVIEMFDADAGSQMNHGWLTSAEFFN